MYWSAFLAPVQNQSLLLILADHWLFHRVSHNQNPELSRCCDLMMKHLLTLGYQKDQVWISFDYFLLTLPQFDYIIQKHLLINYQQMAYCLFHLPVCLQNIGHPQSGYDRVNIECKMVQLEEHLSLVDPVLIWENVSPLELRYKKAFNLEIKHLSRRSVGREDHVVSPGEDANFQRIHHM